MTPGPVCEMEDPPEHTYRKNHRNQTLQNFDSWPMGCMD